MSDEKTDALKLAERVLDRPNADPDDDLAMLARQLIRSTERAEQAEALVGRLREALVTAKVCLSLLEKHVRPPHPDDWPFEMIDAALADPLGTRLAEPTPTELIHQLRDALGWPNVASPDSPKVVWERTLARLAEEQKDRQPLQHVCTKCGYTTVPDIDRAEQWRAFRDLRDAAWIYRQTWIATHGDNTGEVETHRNPEPIVSLGYTRGDLFAAVERARGGQG